jgi:excinuclease ABC subunit B
VSATPADLELERAEGIIVEQVIRPTGLLDPPIEVRPCTHQVDDLVEEIRKVIDMSNRVLVTTLTKRMAEELSKYLEKINISTRYIHSEVKTLDRVAILQDLRDGVFDVLVGVNLLREGLDLPEVSLVAIMDADKEGFLRSVRSLTQTAGRAARNVNGRVIMYADKVTKSMQITIDETSRRRIKQEKYNELNGLSPKQIKRSAGRANLAAEPKPTLSKQTSDPVLLSMSIEQLNKQAEIAKRSMDKAAKELDFMEAARLRDEFFTIKNLLEVKG